jgi:tetratricopeptide (TPR) repeat protein
MNKTSYQIIFLLLLSIGLFLDSCTQVARNELPLTTTSEEAREAFYQGREYYFLFNYDEASTEFKKAIQLDENFALAYLFLELSYPSSSEVDEYRKKYAELADQTSEGEALLLKSFQLNREGKGDQARDNFEKLYEMYPDDPVLPYLIGWNFYWDDDEKYIDLMNRTIEIDPDFPHVYAILGQKYAFLKQWDQAEKAYQKYAELLPERAMPVITLARMYREQGDLDKAIESYEKALAIDPEHLWAIPGLGNCHLFRGECNEGRDYFQKWFETGKTFSEKAGALFNIATSYLYEDDIDGAVAGFDRYIAFAEENNEPVDVIWGNAYKGYVLIMNERIDEGAKYYRKGIELISTLDLDDTRRENLLRISHLWEAVVLGFESNFEKAWNEYEIYKKLEAERTRITENKSIPGLYGWLKQMEGQYEEAIENYQKSYDDVFYWTRLAESYEGLGDNEKAKEYYQKVSEHYLNTIQTALYRNKALTKLKEL